MSYATKYIMPFSNELNEFYEVYFDFLDYTGLPSQVISMIDGLKLRSTGGDEDKFYPLLGTECLLNIAVAKYKDVDDQQLTIADLIAEHDNDIRITVYKDQDYTKNIFQGFVVVEDNSQPFLDPPFTLSIRALDCLGLLKGVDLTDFNGDLFAGRLSITDWIGNILYKTGQTLNVRFYFPIRPVSIRPEIAGHDYGNPLDQVFLDAITFQQGELTTSTDPSVDVKASEADDCYTALEKIIRCLRCRLFQQDGVWNVVNIYSYMNPGGYSYHEAAAGTLTDGKYAFATIATASGLKYDVQAGRNQVIHMGKDDAMRYLKLATKWVKLNYNYDQSLNKICNQGLTQGDRNATYDGTIPDEDNPAVTDNYKGYDAFCFTHLDGDGTSGNIHAYPSTSPSAQGYIREVQDILGYARDRYLVLKSPTPLITYFRSTKLKIDKGDIFSMDFQWRTRDNVHTSLITYSVAFVYLYGDDGSHYALRCLADGSISGNPTEWVAVDSNFQTGSGGSPNVTSNELTDSASNGWNGVSVNANISSQTIEKIKAPVSGDIEILFMFDKNLGGTEAWFKNITVTIHPFLVGSYSELKGDFNFSTSGNDIKQTQSEDVEISDSPKRYFKGALVDSTGELIPAAWHREGFSESYRFTQIMEYLIYTNTNRIMEKIEGSFRGLTYRSADLQVKQYGYLNSFYFPDHPIPTKKFMLTSFDDDYGTGIGRRVFVEVLEDQNDPGFDVPDSGNYLFQYLFQ